MASAHYFPAWLVWLAVCVANIAGRKGSGGSERLKEGETGMRERESERERWVLEGSIFRIRRLRPPYYTVTVEQRHLSGLRSPLCFVLFLILFAIFSLLPVLPPSSPKRGDEYHARFNMQDMDVKMGGSCTQASNIEFTRARFPSTLLPTSTMFALRCACGVVCIYIHTYTRVSVCALVCVCCVCLSTRRLRGGVGCGN